MKERYSDGFFSVDTEYGFLPIKHPLKKLPEEYQDIQYLIDNLPKILKNGVSQDYITKIPNFFTKIQSETSIFIIQSLYRAYSFIISGYLLEPSYHHFLKTGEYGEGRTILPINLAQPYHYICEKLGVHMWLDYHYAYSLGNYVKKDQQGTLHWKNLDMACSFSGGQNEVGFIMLHVYINELSPALIKSIHDVFNSKTVENLKEGLKLNYHTLKEMNSRRSEMWVASDPKKYNDFRIFIMGSKGNDKIFGEGIIYEGVSDKKLTFRGQTGAQDDIIPTEDIFSGIINYYPENELTKYLMELREYRPKCVQEFLVDLEQTSQQFNIFQTLKDSKNNSGLLYLFLIVFQVYGFRFGHWKFVQSYIMKNTKYAVATGGTPITTWLPNQIRACLTYLNDIKTHINIDSLNSEEKELFEDALQTINHDNFV